MAKPVIFTVDDDPDVLQAIERDLRSRYSERYRILRAASANEALDTLHRLKSRNDAVALLLADQRMPELDGVGFLSQATDIFPTAKRALLTAYADTNAAIEAINSARVHYFLLKPWDPPDQNLYPALDDMLTDFMGSYQPPYEGIQLFGTRWSPKAYELRMFLAQNHLPVGGCRAIQHDGLDSHSS
jgi:thioredoxin reductase (NADPH)